MAGQRLKIKDDLHYKPGGTSRDCSMCNSFIGDFKRHGLGGDFIAQEPRCRVIGLQHSIKYRVNPKHICDRWNDSIHFLRLIGETRFKEMYGEEKLQQALQAKAEREEFEKSRQY